MLKSLGFVLLCSALGGCVTTGEVPLAVISKPAKVSAPEPVPCLAAPHKSPVFSTDKELLTGSGAQVFDKVWSDHLARRGYEHDLAASLAACSGTAKGRPKEEK